MSSLASKALPTSVGSIPATIIMSTPTDFDDTDVDDACDLRPIKTKISGMIIPSIITKQGKVEVSY